MDRTITQHIKDDKEELDGFNISPQRRRHLQDELVSLESYKENHPKIEKDPSPLEYIVI